MTVAPHAALRRVNSALEWLFLAIGAVLFAIYIAVVFAEVFARNYIGLSLIWADEVAVMCFVWSVFLGAAVAVRRQAHYVVDLVPDHYERTQTLVKLAAKLLCVILIYVMIVGGMTFASMGFGRRSFALGLPMAYVFVAVPVSGIAMALFTVEIVVDDLKKIAGWMTTGSEAPK